MSTIERNQDHVLMANDMLAVLKSPPDPAAIARLSENPRYNSTLRTTCVATMLGGGQAPTRCRSLPTPM